MPILKPLTHFNTLNPRTLLVTLLFSLMSRIGTGAPLIHLSRFNSSFFCSEKDIKHDNYLVPFTTYELGLLHKQKGDISTAITVIENAK